MIIIIIIITDVGSVNPDAHKQEFDAVINIIHIIIDSYFFW